MAVTAVRESADPHCLPDVTIRACRVPAGDGDCMVTVWYLAHLQQSKVELRPCLQNQWGCTADWPAPSPSWPWSSCAIPTCQL